jgi:hypothetical protein
LSDHHGTVADRRVKLQRYQRTLGERLGGGGSGRSQKPGARRQETAIRATAKLVAKLPGNQRELLSVELDGALSVIPIRDSREDDLRCVLVTPSATNHYANLDELDDFITRPAGAFPLDPLSRRGRNR